MSHTAVSSPSTVDFPTSDPPGRLQQPAPQLPYLPFRRISLPTAPSLAHRESVVSVASFDSLPEENEARAAPPSAFPAVMRNINGGRKARGRPSSMEGAKRGNKRKDILIKPIDEAQVIKRRKVVDEFFETERAYMDGLDLIYSHFLTPIIASLDTPNPLLERSSLTSIFSNFIDIWNLHRSFFSSLTTLLSASATPPSTSSSTLLPVSSPPPLSPILLSHFPYLSLYTPFVTAFPSTIAALNDLITAPINGNANPSYSPIFAAFISKQEADPRCGKLKLRDWLLTIVQRCPRYLLLLKDLINCTAIEDPEYAQLTSVHALVSKITISLNTSLHTHAQTLSLLALQRGTPNLPFQLIVPGRSLLKRGTLLQVERSVQPREREFLLFSDCLVWLASEDAEKAWMVGWLAGHAVSGSSAGLGRPPMIRSRSKSEAELSVMRAKSITSEEATVSSPSSKVSTKSALASASKQYQHPSPSVFKRHASSGTGNDERWIYKGRAELVDLEIIVTPPRELGEERRFEVLSPEGSFVLYAASEEERIDWTSAMRQAKAQLMVSLNITNPNSTLTSSSSNNHIRRSLQALPYPPSDERIGTYPRNPEHPNGKGLKGKGKKPTVVVSERRGKVDHWVPAIWIPDEKTEGCMRCGRTFGWRRRRHHCRLCGRCICAACSERTFFISDPGNKGATKPARACNACYETVFPLLDPLADEDTTESLTTNVNTINSLNNLSSLLSMPGSPAGKTPQALMAIRSDPMKRDADPFTDKNDDNEAGHAERRERRVRVKSPPRPRSYHQILEDFDRGQEEVIAEMDDRDEQRDGHLEPVLETSEGSPKRQTVDLSSSPPTPPRKEDTARRQQRFSMPAVALQATSVTAQTHMVGGDRASGRSKRFSLILSGRSHVSAGSSGKQRQLETPILEDGKSKHELGKGVAAGKLSELLGRKKS